MIKLSRDTKVEGNLTDFYKQLANVDVELNEAPADQSSFTPLQRVHILISFNISDTSTYS
jgi:hypothetical protein